jgi:hypothetical protein
VRLLQCAPAGDPAEGASQQLWEKLELSLLCRPVRRWQTGSEGLLQAGYGPGHVFTKSWDWSHHLLWLPGQWWSDWPGTIMGGNLSVYVKPCLVLAMCK